MRITRANPKQGCAMYDNGECMTEWLVRLDGHPFDLDDLAKRFTTPKARVIIEEGDYYLASTDFDALAEVDAIRRRGLQILEHMNGIMKVRGDGFQSVTLHSVLNKQPDGT